VTSIQNLDKSAETHPDFRVFTQGGGIVTRGSSRGEHNGNDEALFAAFKFGPRKLDADLGRSAGQDDDSVFAVNCNPADYWQ
jgi:uncharacterized protein (DUF736 family)